MSADRVTKTLRQVTTRHAPAGTAGPFHRIPSSIPACSRPLWPAWLALGKLGRPAGKPCAWRADRPRLYLVIRHFQSGQRALSVASRDVLALLGISHPPMGFDIDDWSGRRLRRPATGSASGP